MGEQPFHSAPLGDDEAGIEKSLRPARIAEFIGQTRILENLRIAIDTAKARKDVLDHVLFSGMPGLGKTTLSTLIAREMDVEIHQSSGPALVRGKDIVGILTRLGRGDVFFIDEIHRVSTEVEEYLYSAMEDFCIDIVLDPGPDARVVPIPVQPFTLVGATTREGLLTAPFRARFGIVEKLELYPADDLVDIIERSVRLMNCEIGRDGARHLADRCRGTPRYANRFLRRIRDVAQYRAGQDSEQTGVPSAAKPLELSQAAIYEGLDRLGIDQHGLDRVGRKLIELLLLSTEPVGLKTLAVSVGEEERTIEDVYEPYLLQRGFIARTPRGRRPTALAEEHYSPRRSHTQEQTEFSF